MVNEEEIYEIAESDNEIDSDDSTKRNNDNKSK